MTRLLGALLITVSAALGQSGFPFADETLKYAVNWPSGLSIGEGSTQARKSGARWDFEFALQAGIPGFAVQDMYHSVATADLCSLEFRKNSVHGRRKSRERTVFDAQNGIATRITENGGKSEIPMGECTRDALAFLYYTRRELGQGRVPPPQAVLFGALYDVKLEYAGAQTITVNEQKLESDRILGTIRGPASDHTFEMFFARDPARTPLRVSVPLAAGSFTLDLVR
jgi:Protein of unknown function (DUF3108)